MRRRLILTVSAIDGRIECRWVMGRSMIGWRVSGWAYLLRSPACGLALSLADTVLVYVVPSTARRARDA